MSTKIAKTVKCYVNYTETTCCENLSVNLIEYLFQRKPKQMTLKPLVYCRYNHLRINQIGTSIINVSRHCRVTIIPLSLSL